MTSLPDEVVPTSHPSFSTPINSFVLPAALEGADGAPATAAVTQQGTRVVAVFESGTPAAAAGTIDEGCFVYAGLPFSHPDLTASLRYPEYVRALTHGCPSLDPRDQPLDRSARWALERPDLPSVVEASALSPAGYTLTPWLLGLALALFLAELALTRRSTTPQPEKPS
jgi:hypothetical protein